MPDTKNTFKTHEKQSLSVDVAIVGGGVAGAALAVALKKSQLTTCLIDPGSLNASSPGDKPSAVDQFDPRVFALNLGSLDFLKQIGVLDSLLESAYCTFDRMFVADGQSTGTLTMSAKEVGESKMGVIVEQRVLLSALYRQLDAITNCVLLPHAKVERLNSGASGEAPSMLTLSTGQKVNATVVVGADGGRSWIRRAQGFVTRQWDYGHRAIVCTLNCEKSHQHTAWQRFMHEGPVAFLPLQGSADCHFVSLVWSVFEEDAQRLLALDDQAFLKQLNIVSEGWLGDIKSVSKRFSFPLKQSHATDYVKESVVLVADAAHTIHPLAGQGLNLGLADVNVLADELLRLEKKGLEGWRQGLTRYQRRRKSDNLMMMGAVEGFKRGFELDSLIASVFRCSAMHVFTQLSPLKRQIIRHAIGRPL